MMIDTMPMPSRRIARDRETRQAIAVLEEIRNLPKRPAPQIVDTPANCLGDPDAKDLCCGNPNGTCGCGCCH